MTSPTLRHWLRGQPCALRAWMFCAGPAVELHHYPTRGALGAPVDLLALPVCRACHDACHRGDVTSDVVMKATWEHWRLMVVTHPEVLRAALREMAG